MRIAGAAARAPTPLGDCGDCLRAVSTKLARSVNAPPPLRGDDRLVARGLTRVVLVTRAALAAGYVGSS